MLCDRCGRLLNRATGRCVCADYAGNAPLPVAVTHPPPERVVPVSAAAAVAVLDLSDRRPKPPPFVNAQAEIPAPTFTDEFPVVLQHAPEPWAKRIAMAAAGLVLLAVAGFGASKLLASGPPPPPPPAPPVTVPAVEVAARAELASTCPAWMGFAAQVPKGERPDPAALGPVVNQLRPHLAAAAGAVPYYAAARDEAEYLQGYAKRTPADIERESVSRVQYAMATVSEACTRA